jgi:hypothetical protein
MELTHRKTPGLFAIGKPHKRPQRQGEKAGERFAWRRSMPRDHYEGESLVSGTSPARMPSYRLFAEHSARSPALAPERRLGCELFIDF